MVGGGRFGEEEGTVRGNLTNAEANPGIADITEGFSDPAAPLELPRVDRGPAEASLGRSPTPELPPEDVQRPPLTASEAPTDQTLDPTSAHIDIGPEPVELSGVAFGARGTGTGFSQTPAHVSVPPESSRPVLRREESVLQEAARVRNSPVHRIGRAAGHLRTQLSTAGRALAVRVTESGVAAMRRFERMPRWKQVLWVAAPYASALALVGFLMLSRPGAVDVMAEPLPAERPTVPIASSAQEGPASANQAPDPAEAQSAALPEVGADPDDGAPRIEEAEEQTSLAPTRLVRQKITLPRGSALYIRPTAEVIRSARLRAGHVVTIYPDFPAPEGWVLGQSEKGTVGFISTLHLAGQRDPQIDRARRRRKARRRDR